MLLLDYVLPGLVMSVHSMLHFDFSLSSVDMAGLDFSLLLRSFTCLGSLLLFFGRAQTGQRISIFDFTSFGSMVLTRGMARLGFVLLALDFLHSGLILPLHKFGQMGFASSIFGMTCMGLTMFVFDLSNFDSTSLVRAVAKFGSLLLIYGSTCGMLLSMFDYVNLESITLVHGFSWVDGQLPVFDVSHLGFLLLVQSMACLGSAFFFFGMLCTDLLLPMLDHSNMESSVLLRSPA